MLLSKITSTVSVPDSSASEVSLISATIPAASLRIGSTFRLWAAGACVTNNGAAVHMIFRLSGGAAGGTAITTHDAATASVAAGLWYYHGIVIVNALGAGTTQMYGSIGGLNSAGSAETDREIKGSAQLTGQDSTIAGSLQLRMNWASAAALNNSYTCHTAIIERLN